MALLDVLVAPVLLPRPRAAVARQRRGMTLVEILAVVIILGLVAGLLALNFSGAFGKAKHETAKAGIGILTQRLEMYNMEHGSYPGSDVGLAVLSDGHATPSASYYLNPDQLIDPWGNAYQYSAPGPDGHPYIVISFGEDGLQGGEGNDRDIRSTNLRELDT